ncbi:MAG TPA: P1 family peptidase, partial [Thermoanaerobaculia bacterium]
MPSFPAGFRVGHSTDERRRTGCTVVLPPPGTTAAVDVRGGAPGTRETGVFTPGNLVSEIHGLLFTGGSAFGLAAAAGVTNWLRRRGVGFGVGPARVPIVAAAVLFDLAVGDPEAFPGEAEGIAACETAREGEVA